MSDRTARNAGGAPKGRPAEARALGPGWQVAIACAFLVLAAYTGFAGLKLWRALHTGLGQGTPALQSRLAAAEVDTILAPARAALARASQTLAEDPDRLMDAAESVAKAPGVNARGAAVSTPSEVVAVSGAIPAPAWRSVLVGGASRPHIGLLPAGDSEESIAVISGPTMGKRRLTASVALDLQGPLQARLGPGVAVVRASDGVVVAGADMPSRIDRATISALKAQRSANLTVDGAARPVSAAPAFDGDILVVSAQASPAEGPFGVRRWGDGVITLLAPLAVGLLLLLVLVRQTRKVTEARRAQDESERKFRLAVEAARCGIWEWRLDRDVVSMSDVTGVMLGWGGGGNAQGADVIARIAAEHQERVRQALRAAAQFGAFDVSFRVVRPGGGATWIDARGQGFDPGPNGFTSIIGVALDVTDERRAELRAQQAERRLSDAIDSVSEAFVLWSGHGRLLMCNQNFRTFFNIEARLLKPGAPRKLVEEVIALAVKQRQGAPGGAGVYELELMDGRWLHVSERRTADGGVVVTASDISALKRQEAALLANQDALSAAVERLKENAAQLAELAEKHREASKSAESASKAKSEFLANMSHELRTPLNAIIGFSDMMQREMFGPLGDRRYREYSADILSSGQHLLSLINDILDMSKIEAGKLTLRPEPLDLAELVEDTVRLVRTRADSGGLTLSVQIGKDVPAVEADYRALKQILLNLLSNAVKFTPRGGRVEVEAEAGADGRVVISVKDTGIGIAEDDLGRLAKPFEQIESQHSKTQQGTGLGLALVKSLVERHGGQLEITSKPGVGTRVSFSVPVAAEESGRGGAAAA